MYKTTTESYMFLEALLSLKGTTEAWGTALRRCRETTFSDSENFVWKAKYCTLFECQDHSFQCMETIRATGTTPRPPFLKITLTSVVRGVQSHAHAVLTITEVCVADGRLNSNPDTFLTTILWSGRGTSTMTCLEGESTVLGAIGPGRPGGPTTVDS